MSITLKGNLFMGIVSYQNPGTVLLVDHDQQNREDCATFLSRLGYVVDSESDGNRALSLWRDKRHDVIICEKEITGIDGFSLLQHVTYQGESAQVIIISRAGEMDDVVKALRLGAADFVTKPIDHDVLEHAVRRAIADHRLMIENRLYQKELEDKNRKLRDSLRVLKEDQEAGLAVQLKMLPPTSACFSGVSIEYRIKPSLYLSGDFIDYFKISDTKLGFYLADVSGHGASSAFVTILLKNMANRLRKKARSDPSVDLGPDRILSIANEELLSLKLGKHLAVFCAVIDLENLQLSYCSAAHFPPPIVLSGDQVVSLDGKGLPVGIFEDAEYEVHYHSLAEGFKVVLFSDGILEVMEQQTVAQKEQFLLEMVRKGTHNMGDILDYLKVTGLESVPDDIAIMTVSQE